MNASGIAHQAPPVANILARVPAAWRVQRLKNIATINRDALPETTNPDFTFEYVDIGAVDTLGQIRATEEVAFGNAPSRARRLVRPGDSIVSTVRTYLRAIAYIDEDAHDLVASTGFATLTPNPDVVPRYLYWWLRGEPFVEEIVARSVGVSYPAVNASDVSDVAIPLPPIREQHQIAEFLDREIGRVDALIAEQERMRSLVLGRRSAEIDRFIEHGGIDSGLKQIVSPWLDSIPESWDFMPLKFCVERVAVGIVINPSHYYEDEGVPVLRGSNIRPGRVSDDDLVFMSDASNELHSKSILRRGDVVVVRTGAAGSAAVVPDWAVGGNIVDLLQVRPGPRMHPKFVELLLNSGLVQRQVASGSVGALQAHFNTAALSNVMVVVPTVPEQDRVLRHLDSHLQRYDDLIAEAGRQVALLTEHRLTLITSAVTGQLDRVDGAA